MLNFGDETHSRRHFEVRNAQFWRRALFSSSFFGEKCSILATRPVLVVVLRREMLNFGDELCSRRRFEAGNAQFWRRALFSSPFLGEKCLFLATSPVLVTIFGWKTSFFGDETHSRRRFEVRNAQFWRRNSFSSSFRGGKLYFLTTNPVLVTIFG
ncbi:hypothetical protein [Caldibacillus thermoamylovorans]|uniref:hypothetical protein n=1 Tax=Caldibacillus thermoamylovorans TaxID=35841 RepID=UPI000AFD8E94|nr:hypothetical protein [Caldibacillus thermoamylovorans]